jgi:hypothetical protein
MSKEEAEKLRQEGREEVFNWLVGQNILNYSSHDKIYFKYDGYKEILTVMPWRKASDVLSSESPKN